MKVLIRIALCLTILTGAASAESTMPSCQGEDHMQWTNCFGTYLQKKSLKVDGVTLDYTGEFGSSPGKAGGKGSLKIFKDEILVSTYNGEFKDDKHHGQGTYTWSVGAKYVGEFVDGKRNGQGTFTFPSGDKYVGEFKDDQQNGQGTYTWSNGKIYVGEFVDGIKNGQGTHTWPDGRIYVGEFKDDLPNGQGTLTSSNGDKYVGEFVDGIKNGQGTYTWSDGRIYVGEFKDDKILKLSKNSKNKEEQKAKSSPDDNQIDFQYESVYPIYDNITKSYDLAGIKLYDRIGNLNILGKIIWIDGRTELMSKVKNYEDLIAANIAGSLLTNIFSRNNNNEKLVIDSVTDNDGGFLDTDFFLKQVSQANSNRFFIVEPENKNDLFNLYFVHFTPHEKRVTAIYARSSKVYSYDEHDLCQDDRKNLVNYFYEKFIKKNYKLRKSEVYRTFPVDEISGNTPIVYIDPLPEKYFYEDNEDFDPISAKLFAVCKKTTFFKEGFGNDDLRLYLVLTDFFDFKKGKIEANIVKDKLEKEKKEKNEKELKSKMEGL